MKRTMRIGNWLLLALLTVTFSSCSSRAPVPTDQDRREARQRIGCVLVLPVETAVNQQPEVSYQEAAVLEQGAAFMDSVIAELLVGRDHVRVLSERQVTALMPQSSGTRLALMKKIGSELQCEAVLTTTLSTYRQRVGGSLGAEDPASATFSMHLFDARDGTLVWSAQFKETQQSLFSDILSFGKASSRGFKWITVEELVRQGLAEKIEACPYL